MADPLTGSDTYDILSGLSILKTANEQGFQDKLADAMREWSRMGEDEASQVDWRLKARWFLKEGSYEIKRLRALEAKVKELLALMGEKDSVIDLQVPLAFRDLKTKIKGEGIWQVDDSVHLIDADGVR